MEMDMDLKEIDWSKFIEPVTQTCYCYCGARYRSHAKACMNEGKMMMISQKPCPVCDKHDNMFRIVNDPERWTVG